MSLSNVEIVQLSIKQNGQCHIPRRPRYGVGGYLEGVYVIGITEPTIDPVDNSVVSGHVYGFQFDRWQPKEGYRGKFRVKHDGKSFRLGSGSSVRKFFLEDADKPSNQLYDVVSTSVDRDKGVFTVTFYGTDLNVVDAYLTDRKVVDLHLSNDSYTIPAGLYSRVDIPKTKDQLAHRAVYAPVTLK